MMGDEVAIKRREVQDALHKALAYLEENNPFLCEMYTGTAETLAGEWYRMTQAVSKRGYKKP